MTKTARYKRLLARRAPSEDRLVYNFSEGFERQPGESIAYILGAMRPVEKKYTDRLIAEGDRVENQLTKRLADTYRGLKFRRQGSVSNGTHIRYYSDVDVLVITGAFFTLEPPQRPTSPYSGDPLEHLLELRADSARELRAAFPAATVDDSGSKAICISKGSLSCAVDVVPSNWFNTNSYKLSGKEHDRGIEVADREEHKRVANFPFLYNYRM